MEDLAPPFVLATEIRRGLENGEHVRIAVKKFLDGKKSDFHSVVLKWFLLVERGEKTDLLLATVQSPYRRSLLSLCEKSFKGASISNPLKDLEEEIANATQAEVDAFISKLPLLALIPLLLFQFPAFMLLLVGPILSEAMMTLGGLR